MKKEELKEILQKMKCDCIDFQGECHDCGKKVQVSAGLHEDQIIAEGGAVFKVNPPSIREDNVFVKCDKCFQVNPRLTGFRKNEVFSRCCGYLRPIEQYNKGKQEEFKQRLCYSLNKAVAKHT